MLDDSQLTFYGDQGIEGSYICLNYSSWLNACIFAIFFSRDHTVNIASCSEYTHRVDFLSDMFLTERRFRLSSVTQYSFVLLHFGKLIFIWPSGNLKYFSTCFWLSNLCCISPGRNFQTHLKRNRILRSSDRGIARILANPKLESVIHYEQQWWLLTVLHDIWHLIFRFFNWQKCSQEGNAD